MAADRDPGNAASKLLLSSARAETGMAVTTNPGGGVQISVGKPHDLRSIDLDEAETMRLVAVLRLAVADEAEALDANT